MQCSFLLTELYQCIDIGRAQDKKNIKKSASSEAAGPSRCIFEDNTTKASRMKYHEAGVMISCVK
ncbi:hypothetical protein MSG28_008723 [Choristoneura fumiferana]|uniref:Uncharacterized protein n=1 Tax=Choristoneura fumiferana TaxID=7141 RepID=A0ACC0J7R6_CHOFU|nr:hypothetical protein MSG28_008723 [Choristoneura fumiferana]